MASMTGSDFLRRAEAAANDLRRLDPSYAPTPLHRPERARGAPWRRPTARQGRRPRMLGSFKSLGGTYAGLLALARLKGMDISGFLAMRPGDLPALDLRQRWQSWIGGRRGCEIRRSLGAYLPAQAACLRFAPAASSSRAARLCGWTAPTMMLLMLRRPLRARAPAYWLPTRRMIPAIPSSAM